MIWFVEFMWEVIVLDEYGQFLCVDDYVCWFFEGVWMYKYQGWYYFLYFIGDMYLLCYVVGDSLYGLFIYCGVIFIFVVGWIIYYFICVFEGQWYFFYYDVFLFGGVIYLCLIKVVLLYIEVDGSIWIFDFYGV